MFAEPEPIPKRELSRIARQTRTRHELENTDDILAQRIRSISIRLKEAARQKDWQKCSQLRDELAELTDQYATAA